MILILSRPDDGHIPFVTKHLRTGSIVIDAGAILAGDSLTYLVDGKTTHLRFKERELTNVTGVWLRRPRLAKSLHDIPVEDRFKSYCQSALHWHVQQLYTALPNAFWLPDHFAMIRADNKMLQLNVAASVGLRVPKTILTSSGREARKFVRHTGAAIAKPISRHGLEVVPIDSPTMRVMYTHRLAKDDTIDDDSLRVAPTIFQELIEPLFDIRVIVVGSQVFAAKIISSDLPKARDWRAHNRTGKLQIGQYKLSPHIEKLCLKLTKRLGLHFGAIDLVQGTDNGEPYFLEINPNGQWAFVEEETGQEIGKAIARLLETGRL